LKQRVACGFKTLDQLLLHPPRHSHQYVCALDEMERLLLGVRAEGSWYNPPEMRRQFFTISMETACGISPPPARDAPAAKRARHDA